jgi:hypothetical protein
MSVFSIAQLARAAGRDGGRLAAAAGRLPGGQPQRRVAGREVDLLAAAATCS